jgi:hypothetical protein
MCIDVKMGIICVERERERERISIIVLLCFCAYSALNYTKYRERLKAKSRIQTISERLHPS